jgi:hypothetical protein
VNTNYLQNFLVPEQQRHEQPPTASREWEHSFNRHQQQRTGRTGTVRQCGKKHGDNINSRPSVIIHSISDDSGKPPSEALLDIAEVILGQENKKYNKTNKGNYQS